MASKNTKTSVKDVKKGAKKAAKVVRAVDSVDKRRSDDPKSAVNIAFVIFAVVLAAVSLLFFAAGFKGIEGALLVSVFCKIVYGLFGYAAFLVIPILIAEAVCWKKNVVAHTRAFRLVHGALLMILASTLVHSVCAAAGSVEVLYSPSIFFGSGDISDSGVYGGGFFGGTIHYLLDYLLGYNALTIIFAVVLFLIDFMFFFKISPVKIFRMIKANMPDENEREERKKMRLEEKERIKKEREEEEKREREKEEAKLAKIRAEREEREAARKRIEEEDAEKRRQIADAKKNETSSSDIDFEFDEQPKKQSRITPKIENLSAEKTQSDEAGSTVKRAPLYGGTHKDEQTERKIPTIVRKDTPIAIEKNTELDYEEYAVEDIFKEDTEIEEASVKNIATVTEDDIPDNTANEAPIVNSGLQTAEEKRAAVSASLITREAKASEEDFGKDFSLEDVALGEDEPLMKTVEIPVIEEEEEEEYVFPPIDLMQRSNENAKTESEATLLQKAEKLIDILESFNVKADVVNIACGPTITRYELVPKAGVRVRQISNLVDDIALNLGVSGIRIEAPIPGKAAVGIEVPNSVVADVKLRDIIECEKFQKSESPLTACLGKDVVGAPVIMDIEKMPHLLVAGATGQGKSVGLNCIIVSLLYKASPKDLKFILIDPKKVELSDYNNLPHLLIPVVTSAKKAAGALASAVTEMERRYELLEANGVKNIKGYTALAKENPNLEYLPRIVIIIDELNDIMITARDTVEDSISRLAAKARAAGIHLIACTQRPSVDVITGVIKANIPSRIAFTVKSLIDSRTILDEGGAEKLIGRGDMLFVPVGSTSPLRCQGAYVSDKEIASITDFIKEQSKKVKYNDEFIKLVDEAAAKCDSVKKSADGGAEAESDGAELDTKFWDACDVAFESGKISTSLIQRRLSLGYGRAAKIIDVMEQMGIVGPQEGQKPRNLAMSREDYLTMRMNQDNGSDDDDGLE